MGKLTFWQRSTIESQAQVLQIGSWFRTSQTDVTPNRAFCGFAKVHIPFLGSFAHYLCPASLKVEILPFLSKHLSNSHSAIQQEQHHRRHPKRTAISQRFTCCEESADFMSVEGIGDVTRYFRTGNVFHRRFFDQLFSNCPVEESRVAGVIAPHGAGRTETFLGK